MTKPDLTRFHSPPFTPSILVRVSFFDFYYRGFTMKRNDERIQNVHSFHTDSIPLYSMAAFWNILDALLRKGGFRDLLSDDSI